MHQGNNDLASLLINYIQCNTIKNGVGMGTEFLKTDDLNKKLFGYLLKVNQSLANELIEDRKHAEQMFNEAIKN